MLVFRNRQNPAFLMIFVPLKHKFYTQTVGFSEVQTQTIGVEGKHAYLLTTTMAQNDLGKIKYFDGHSVPTGHLLHHPGCWS